MLMCKHIVCKMLNVVFLSTHAYLCHGRACVYVHWGVHIDSGCGCVHQFKCVCFHSPMCTSMLLTVAIPPACTSLGMTVRVALHPVPQEVRLAKERSRQLL